MHFLLFVESTKVMYLLKSCYVFILDWLFTYYKKIIFACIFQAYVHYYFSHCTCRTCDWLHWRLYWHWRRTFFDCGFGLCGAPEPTPSTRYHPCGDAWPDESSGCNCLTVTFLGVALVHCGQYCCVHIGHVFWGEIGIRATGTHA